MEKKVHDVEIWGRDNDVQKSEFEKATDRLADAIKSMGPRYQSRHPRAKREDRQALMMLLAIFATLVAAILSFIVVVFSEGVLGYATISLTWIVTGVLWLATALS